MHYRNKPLVETDGVNGLVKPIGLVLDVKGFYVADNISGLILHFDKNGDSQLPTRIIVPQAPGAPHPTPTGLVLNTSKGFVIGKTVDEPTCTSFISKNLLADII